MRLTLTSLILLLGLCSPQLLAQFESSLLDQLQVHEHDHDHSVSLHSASAKTAPHAAKGIAASIAEAPRPVPISLDETALRVAAGFDRQADASFRSTEELLVDLPVEGEVLRSFILTPAQAIAPGLAAKFPSIRSYAGVAKDDPNVSIRAEYSDAHGWSYLVNQNGRRIAVESNHRKGVDRHYTLYREAHPASSAFECLVEDVAAAGISKLPEAQSRVAGDCQLRRFRMAITCTGEYARAVDGNNPTPAGVVAAMNVALNRVNEVYEQDLGITLELIPNNEALIFLDGNTDPYTEGSPRDLLDEVQPQIDAIVGFDAYDIGHIFSTRGGGVARLRSPCGANKGRGVTGIGNPVGDPFYIDYVAHEVGHQFGGTHTFNNFCSNNRTPSTAYEPGSGSTIMAYAGICAPNVQSASDPYFHGISIQQIAAFVTSPDGGCGTIVSTTNTAPQLAVAAQQFVIPVGTPFELTAMATDPEGDALTYNWEQFDNETGQTMPPQSTNTAGPTFRGADPTASPTRRFPNPAEPTWEVLPTVPRDLNFVVTVRDNNSSVGCTSEGTAQLETVGSTPFTVTNFNTASTVNGLETVTVTWDVAGTDVAPVNTPLVDIYFSTDGGQTYSDVLATGVANSGTADVLVPNVATSEGRFVVKGNGNVFLDFNDADITVTPAVVPTFLLSTTGSTSLSACLETSIDLPLEIESILGFSGRVGLEATNLPAGLILTFSNIIQNAPFSSVATFANLDAVAPGSYTLEILATSGTIVRELTILFVKDAPPPVAPAIVSPLDGADLGLAVTDFEWNYDNTQGEVVFQLSSDPSFSQNVFADTLDNATLRLANIPTGVYYWRIAYLNGCGLGAWSRLQSFREIPLDEQVFTNSTPVTIGSGNPARYEMSIDVVPMGEVYRVEVETDLSHSFSGDLRGELDLPGNLTNRLFLNSLQGQCPTRDISASFSDVGDFTAAAFVATCSSSAPAVSGSFLPVDAFFPELPREGQGTYTLAIFDDASADGGRIESFSLRLWYGNLPQFNTTLTNERIRLPTGSTQILASTRLRATTTGVAPASTFFVLKELPEAADLLIGGVVLNVGQAFSQQQIDAGEVSLRHNTASSLTTDEFVVDLLAANGEYLPNVAVQLDIVTNTLFVTGAIVQTIDCAGNATGEMGVQVTGGQSPFQYQLNQGVATSNSSFDGLAAGTYAITVTDADGFSRTTLPFVLADPDPIVVMASSAGNDVSATASGGTGTLVFSLDATNFQATGSFLDLANGTYSVTVRDDNGCTGTAQVLVSVDALVVGLSITEDIRCNGETATLEAAAAGGTPPYTFQITGGSPQMGTTFANLPGGSYILTVSDSDGNSQMTTTPVVVVEPTILSAQATVAMNTLTIGATGGTPDYQYSIGGGFQVSNTFSGLTNGMYAITVRDANGCETTTSATVSVNTLVLTVQLQQNVLCAGEDNGALTANATGGMPPYSYSIPGRPAQTSGFFDDLAPGTYVVTVTDSEGLTRMGMPITITEPDELQVSASEQDNTFTVSVVGGTLPVTIQGPTPVNSDGTFGPYPEGTYSFTATDATGCVASISASIGPSDLELVIDQLLGQESCPGASDGEVTVVATGGVEPYTYALNTGTFVASNSFAALAPGAYTVSVQDVVGDVVALNFTIQERAEPVVDLLVEGSRITIANLTPASSGVSYSFDGGASFTTDSVGYIYTAGQVTLQVRYGNCTVQYSVNVTNPLNVEQQTSLVACPGDDLATAFVCVSGGDGALVLTPSVGTATTGSDPDCDNYVQVQVPVGTTSTTLVVTDPTGAEQTLVLDVLEAPEFDIIATVSGTSVTLTTTAGTGPFTYSLDGSTFQASNTFDGLDDGGFTATVRDAFGCETTTTFAVSSAQEVARQLGLVAFPNPFSESLEVRVQDGVELRFVRVFDVSGRQVLAQAVGGTSASLRTSSLQAGFYLLAVEHQDGLVHVPVIKR